MATYGIDIVTGLPYIVNTNEPLPQVMNAAQVLTVPVGAITSTDLQSALQEIDELISPTTSLNAEDVITVPVGELTETDLQSVIAQINDRLIPTVNGVVPNLPWSTGGQGQVYKHNNELYILRRDGTPSFCKLSLDTYTYTILADAPVSLETSGGVGYDGVDYIYTVKGGTSYTVASGLYRYQISTDTWSTLSPAVITESAVPIGTGDGLNRLFYLFYGIPFVTSSDSQFYLTVYPKPIIYVNGIPQTLTTHYTLNSDTGLVTFVTAPAIGAVITSDWNLGIANGSSSAMPIYDGNMYMIVGDDISVFLKYNISTDTWSLMALMPKACDWSATASQVYYIDTDPYLYVMRGEDEFNVDTVDFYRYNISTNSWTALTPVPETVDAGSMIMVGNWILCAVGKNSLKFYAYNITNNSWVRLEDLPIAMLRGSISIAKTITNGNAVTINYIVNGGATVNEVHSRWITLYG